ncbi:MAG: tRNA glutamyl-Q(34) synthetase GluQRS [Sphingomicrobium sp.]
MLVTRFAPSPTGRLHLGHAFSAAIGHRAARSAGGRFLLRIEDLDPARSHPEFIAGIEQDLHWLGIDWDAPPIVQSARSSIYAAPLERLREQGLVYPCFCTRSDIAAAHHAPHEPLATYPGTCRGLPDQAARRASSPHSWRLDATAALALTGLPGWREGNRDFHSTRDDFDDVILARKDAPAAYHLACVVDDGASAVSLVVRGADLRASTPVQRLLQLLLGLPEPGYLHHALVTHADGRRLAKRDRSPTLQSLRESGIDGSQLRKNLAMRQLPGDFRLMDA